ncbi:MAG TPA: fibronectin type III domain-containing protein [Candidatus Paceibacterota bacterium]|nr:fibronectin type III domain-containing protein [Candidatus Paceibacterota bacterium]
MKNELGKKITSIALLFTLFIPFLTFAVTGDTNINLQVTGTTTEPTPTPTPPPSQFVDIIPPVIYSLFISKTTFDSASIEWKTDELALCQVFWGITQEYKEGIISETVFNLSHKTSLISLLSETNYNFKIRCRDSKGNEAETKNQRFTTLSLPDTTAPANVSNFEAIPNSQQITLQWQNPADDDFKIVRIMRSEEFYPQNPWEGKLIFEGSTTSFVDMNLTNGKRYYYTAFSYDFAGNFSSGAVASAIPRIGEVPLPDEITVEQQCLEAGFYWYDNSCHFESQVISGPPEVEGITLNDFEFIQKGIKLLPIEENIEVQEKDPLTISINYEKVPEVLKTIMVTLQKGNKTFSFLLRINNEKTAYLASLVPPVEPGAYPAIVSVLDYQHQVLKKIPAQITVKETEKAFSLIFWLTKYYLYLILIITIIFVGISFFYIKKFKAAK